MHEETAARTAPPDAEEKETGRLEAFSDGVFAVAITLLVLDFKVPRPETLPAGGLLGSHGLLAALFAQWPIFLAYLTSFLSILVMWVNHHLLFTLIRRTTHLFLYLNGLLLLFVTFVPFAASLVAAYLERPEASAAAALYSTTFFAIAIVFNLIWHHAKRRHLLGRTASPRVIAEIDRSYRFGPPLYALAFALAFVHLTASLLTCLALAVFFSATGAHSRRVVRGRG